MTGWGVALLSFVAGWVVCAAVHRRTCEPVMAQLIRRLYEAEADIDHQRCQLEAARQRDQLAQYEQDLAAREQTIEDLSANIAAAFDFGRQVEREAMSS